MKFSAMRQHKKINANCEKMVREYLEMLRLGNTQHATTLRRRIQSRYGKDVFAIMGVELDETDDK